jgi:GAF domain-containing protein
VDGARLQAICRELVELLDVEGCALSRVLGELLIEVAEYSRSGRTLQLGHGYLVPDYPLTQEVLESREARIVSLLDPAPDPSEATLLRELGFESLLMLPLESAGECWGLIELFAAGGRRFDADDVRRAEPVLRRASS